MMAEVMAAVLSLTYPDMKQSLCFIATNKTMASCLLLEDGRVVTANHVYKKKGVYVEREPFTKVKGHTKATVIKRDTENDLMLLKTDLVGRKVEFAEPELGEPVIALVYADGLEMLIRGHVCGFAGNFVLIDANLMLGSSGGPIYNQEGKVIGIVSFQMRDGGKAIIAAVSGKVIEGYLE